MTYLQSAHHRQKSPTSVTVTQVITALSLLIVAAAVASWSSTPAPVTASEASITSPIPLFAYYYIWFDTNSWRRAKTDYPLLGPYSSDDTIVLRQHVEWA